MNANNPLTLDLIPKFSLQISDLWRHLPNHRLYQIPQPPLINETVRNINFGFLGFVFVFFLIISLVYLPIKTFRWWILLGFACFITALGPIIQWSGGEIKSIIYPLFYNTELYQFMRIPARIYSITIIVAIVIISLFLAYIDQKKSILFSLILIISFFFENVPEKFHLFSAEMIKPPKEMLDFFKSCKVKSDVVVAITPSSIFTGKPYNDYGISEFSREYIYAYWQTHIKVNMVNGMCGFCPDSRIKFNELLKKNGLSGFLQENEITHIVFIKSPYFTLEENEIFKENNLSLFCIVNNKRISIYEY
jgi:hypothetical protein